MQTEGFYVVRAACCAAIGLVAAGASAGSILFVDDDAPPGGDGLSWATAYRSPQDALIEAGGGRVSEIRVAQGTYTPVPGPISSCCAPHGGQGCDDLDCETSVCTVLPTCCVIVWDEICVTLTGDLCGTLCTDTRVQVFQLLDGVTLTGGYAGVDAPNPNDRNVALYETILSGDLAGNDGPGPIYDNAENSYTVVLGSGTNSTAVIDGFTIRAGNADGPSLGELEWTRGGGMANIAGSPTVRQCTFQANVVLGFGGGMYNSGSDPHVTDCMFLDNVAGDSGGGMFNNFSSPHVEDSVFIGNEALESFGSGGGLRTGDDFATISGCRFEGNTAAFGGGVATFRSNATITGCEFINNLSLESGGGLVNGFDGVPQISDCTFTGNMAVGNGGGVHNIELNPVFTGCTLSDNSAGSGGALFNAFSSPVIRGCRFLSNTTTAFGVGGAITNSESSSPEITNSLFKDNLGDGGGGAIATGIDCFPLVTNCTIVQNVTNGAGGGLYTTDLFGGHSELTVRNSIVHNNSGGEIDTSGGAITSVQYSNVQGGYVGQGNIDADPLFVNSVGGDLHVLPGSPCIDAGDNTAVPAGVTTDLDGNARFLDDPYVTDTGCGLPPIVDMGAFELCLWDCGGDHDGNVGIVDFLALLAQWNQVGTTCDFGLGAAGVGINEFLDLLAHWGPCS